MRFYEVSITKLIGRDFGVLTYSSLDAMSAGQIVEIEVGSRKIVGVIIKETNKPTDFEVKAISRKLVDKPLPAQIMSLHRWMCEFYNTESALVWQTMLPEGLGKNRRSSKTQVAADKNLPSKDFTFNNDQIRAIDKLVRMHDGTAILHGVTGSGKTEVYKALALESNQRGLSSIVLVPEISLTAQLVEDFRRDFEKVIVTHSSMTNAERHKVWLEVLNSEQPMVIIGPRSALFMPIANLGLVVIDECHEPSYKQDKSPRYNTLRVASLLSGLHKSRLILGSATPLISDMYTAKKLGRPIVEMKNPARKNAKRSTVTTIDLTKRSEFSPSSHVLSKKLIDSIRQTLAQGKQSLLFHNRRGSASVTLCTDCGWISKCPNCDLPMTLHADKFELKCHICGYKTNPPTSCPECKSATINHKGFGTKKIESEINLLFPNAKVKRFDSDTDRGQAVHEIFDEIVSGEIDIIIGTQAVAKGLDLPNLRLVGIVQADAGLALPDFSASERTFQLIAQASGRVGRDVESTDVIIQTFQPNSPAIKFGAAQDYSGFYEHEIALRAKGHFPPFSHLLKLTCVYKTEKGAVAAAQKLARGIRASQNQNVKILGPSPSFYERVHGTYRWQIIVRSADRKQLIDIAKKVPPVKWQVELDPISLI